MKNSLPYIVNLPPFMYTGVNVDSFNALQKILFFIKGKILSFIINRTSGGIFCFFINRFYKKDGKIYFKNNFYIKNLRDGNKIYYSNKRILRVVNNHKLHFNKILETYCIEDVDLQNNDVVIDCGANVGEVNIALRSKNINVNYYGFEPDPKTFESLKLNSSESTSNLFNLGLSDKDEETLFYLDNYGGNSSLIDFGSKENIKVKTKRLDSFDFGNSIKLLKIDAEGLEPEVLKGSIGIIEKIKYISVDFGAERGEKQGLTVVDVNDFLYNNNFSLVSFSEHRLIGLYLNNGQR